MLRLAQQCIDEARSIPAGKPGARYAVAHMAALRTAAAVLAARAVPAGSKGMRSRGRPASAWQLLASVAPEFAEWATFFAAGARKRAAAEAGVPGAVTAREADDLVRDTELFLTLVRVSLARAASVAERDRRAAARDQATALDRTSR